MASQKPNKSTVTHRFTKPGNDEEEFGGGGSSVVPEILTFHPTEHKNVVLSNDLRTATATRNFYSFAMTSRDLQSNECFSVILDDCAPTLSFYFGVRNNLPSNSNRYRSWLMEVDEDSLSLIKNGMWVRDYGRYPYRPQVGYRYSVVQKSNGDVHFEVNGRDLGVAFTTVTEKVKLLWEDPLNKAWAVRVAYRWKLLHRPKIGLIRVKIFNGPNMVADSGNIYDNTLQGGRMGVFCFSQEMIYWSDLLYKCNDNVPAEVYKDLPLNLQRVVSVE